MNPRAIAIVLILAAVGVGVWLVSKDSQEEAAPAQTAAATPIVSPTPDGRTVVTLTDEGFSPRDISVGLGREVVFKNESGSPVVVASDPHPTHTALGGFESDSLAPGQTYRFKFTKTGTWGFHNHLNPSQTGEVTVR